MDERFLECGAHGRQQATFVCQHIVQSFYDQKSRGFLQAHDPKNPRPHAWCNACEEIYQQEGEWNDTSEGFAKISLLCGACYDTVWRMNH